MTEKSVLSEVAAGELNLKLLSMFEYAVFVKMGKVAMRIPLEI
jgi:hypothetical protein